MGDLTLKRAKESDVVLAIRSLDTDSEVCKKSGIF